MKHAPRIALVLLPSLAACSDLFMEAERVPTTLVLGDSLVTTVEGRAVPITVTVLDQNGEPFERLGEWAAPQWVSSGAAVEVRDGALVAATSGQAQATVQVAGMTATARVRVNPAQLRLRVKNVQLTQSAQPEGGTAPVVQGRAATLRVFLEGDRPNFFGPQVRVRVYNDAALVRTLTASASAIPTEVNPGKVEETWNVLIPGELVVPGLRLLVEADPQGVVPLATGSTTVFPASGVPLAATVRAVPPLYLRMIPIRQTSTGATGTVNAANLDLFLQPLREMFPVNQVSADIHATYTTSASASDGPGWSTVLREVAALRAAEGSGRYYYGVVRRTAGGIAGIGYLGFPSAAGFDRLPDAAQTMAHELGHNFNRQHAPCGGPAGTDLQFPTQNAVLDVHGWHVEQGTVRTPLQHHDLMSYCAPEWITHYTYSAIMAYRDRYDWNRGSQSAAPEPVLLVWGSVRGGEVILEPAFEMVAPPSLPRGEGPYRVEARDAAGAPLLSLSFDAAAVQDAADGERHFAFAIPTRALPVERLAELRLSAAGASAVRVSRAPAAAAGGFHAVAPRFSVQGTADGRGMAVRWDRAAHPMVLVRDPATGQVLSFARGGEIDVQTRAAEVELLFSDGVRTTRQRVRTGQR